MGLTIKALKTAEKLIDEQISKKFICPDCRQKVDALNVYIGIDCDARASCCVNYQDINIKDGLNNGFTTTYINEDRQRTKKESTK